MNTKGSQHAFVQQRATSPVQASATSPMPSQKLVFETRVVSNAKRSGISGASRNGRMRAFNDILAYSLVGIVLVAAVPVGSNRPVFWAMWTEILAVLCFTYTLTLTFRAPDRAFRSASYRGIFALGGFCLLWAGVQILPLFAGFSQPAIAPSKTISIDPDASFLGLIRLAAYGMIFFLLIEVASQKKRAQKLAWLLFGGIVLHGVWALAALNLQGDTFFWGEKSAYLGSATGTFINRNSFATFMGMGGVLGVALVTEYSSRPRGRLPKRSKFMSSRGLETLCLCLCLCLLIVGFALISSQSRMGVVATGLAALATYLMVAAKNIGLRLALKRGLAIAVPLAIFGIVVLGQGLLERTIFIVQNGETRLELWRQCLAMIADRPLMGFGLDSFYPAFQSYHQTGLSSAVTWEYAHSTYLVLWVELGLIAGSLPLIALGWIGCRLGRVYQKSDSVLVPASMGVLLLGGVHSLVDFSLEMQANAFLFLTVLALGLAVSGKTREP